MKTRELTGAALDWAVDMAAGNVRPDGGLYAGLAPGKASTDWAQGGPIIEREKIEITPWGTKGEWRARDFYEPSPGVPCAEQYGPTPLIAAMRCYVASKLGDEIEISKELT